MFKFIIILVDSIKKFGTFPKSYIRKVTARLKTVIERPTAVPASPLSVDLKFTSLPLSFTDRIDRLDRSTSLLVYACFLVYETVENEQSSPSKVH